MVRLADRIGRPLRITYIVDYVPAGVRINHAVIAELRGHPPEFEVEEVRIAITPEQAAVLPSKPRNSGNRRRLDIRETVEAEAMPAGELRQCSGRRSKGSRPRRNRRGEGRRTVRTGGTDPTGRTHVHIRARPT